MLNTLRQTCYLTLLLAIFMVTVEATGNLFLIGDSTLAKGYGQVLGWGAALQTALTKAGVNGITVNDQAIPGSNAATWTNQGHFAEVAKMVGSGDFVFIELGTNDVAETPQAFEKYITEAVKTYQANKATTILASMVPHNLFDASAGAAGPPPSYVAAMKSAAAATNSKFIDMYNLVLSAMKASGSGAGLYVDNLHTTVTGAAKIAEVGATALAPILGEKENTPKTPRCGTA